ncbi:MAG TPA: rhodanese-like domain-containing protein [Gemmatimonadaceae bacterium]|nr:rhodanese-like domain-containing protein [Gemmatimonadaceae bacterium]
MPPKSAAELIAEAKTRIREVTPRDVKAMLDRGDRVTLVDVREDREWNLGHLPGAQHMSRGTVEGKIEVAVPREAKVVLYCAGGNRSALAADMLRQMGYADVASMSGGFKGWVDMGGDVEG